jgi:hypothetical protein
MLKETRRFYIYNVPGIKGELASKVFDLVGGRMIHLGYVASKLSGGDLDLNGM